MSRILLSFLCLALNGQAQYVGAQVCGSCHTSQMKQQSQSEHARALRPVADHPLAPFFAQGAPPRGESESAYEAIQSPQGLTVRVTAGKQEFNVPVQWAFGAGDQAVTFVSQINEDAYIEHRFSLYSETRKLDLTPGHPVRSSPVFPAIAGVVYPTFAPESSVLRCFGCHSTGNLSLGPKMDIVPAELGVRCEACHGPGAAHVSAMRRGEAGRKSTIGNPRRLSATALNDFCGNCHRMPARGETATNWTDAWNVRHQPIYLAQSACFRKSEGALSCLTCHDPHQPLRRSDAAFYNGKCVACHPNVQHSTMTAGKPQGCISCHMPAVSPREHLTFANHWIGVYRTGSVLKPDHRR